MQEVVEYHDEDNVLLNDDILIMTVKTWNVLIAEKDNGGRDALLLYQFYLLTAQRQKTNQIKASVKFCTTGLGIGRKKFLQAKRLLEKYNLITQVVRKSPGGKIKGWYIRINYLFKQRAIYQMCNKEQVASDSINALSKYNINALSKDNIYNTSIDGSNFPLKDNNPSIKDSKSSLQEIVDYYFTLKNYTNKEWVKSNYARYVRIAKKLLKYADRDVEKVKKIIKRGQEKFKEKHLSWTLETIEKYWPEIERSGVRYG